MQEALSDADPPLLTVQVVIAVNFFTSIFSFYLSASCLCRMSSYVVKAKGEEECSQIV
jgi:hypothetical protein